MTYASAQDLKLWYEQPAQKWVEALPIGNGRIGAMVFGGVEEDRIQFNEETLWTGEPRDYNRKGAYKYLDTIRQLLFQGKQKQAEDLAGKEFMGLKSDAGNIGEWLAAIRAYKGVKGNPAMENFDDSKWKTMQVPSYEGWEAVGYEGLDGAVWFRTSFVLLEGWAGKNLQLDLNRIRDQDFTYVNGKLVGSENNADARNYVIPAKFLHAGKNTIAVQVINYTDKGGIAGYKDTARHIGIYPVGREAEKISLNGHWKYLVQNDEPPAVAVYEASYQPFGDLFLRFHNKGTTTKYYRGLDLETATAHTSYSIDGVNYRREYFVSQPNQAAVVHLEADKKGSISFDAILSSPHKKFTLRRIDNNTIALHVQVRTGALHGDSYLRVITQGGLLKIENGKLVVADADQATLYLTVGTNYKNYHDISVNSTLPCTKALASLTGKSYEQIKAAHIKEYQKYFNTFSIKLNSLSSHVDATPPSGGMPNLPTDQRLKKFSTTNDPAFTALYMQYGRYLLISSSRPGTRPANLQGIWNDLMSPPWGSKYTTNINTEMNYWPAELLNLSAMHEPLFQMIKELSDNGKQTAKEYYDAPGWVLHHNTDLWRATVPINASNHGIWVSGGAWLCHHLWEHYLFTQDKDFLRNTAYPIMKSAALFFNDFLVKDPATGYLISTPSNSPEQGGLVAGPTMDHQVIRDLFKNVITSSKILDTDEALATILQKKYEQIAPNKIGRYGQLQEWMQDIDDTSNKHRHISHLWGMYPGSEINWDQNPELMKAARQSLIYRGDAATGWSLGWKINCWARFKDGDHAYKMLQMLLSPAGGGAGSYPNLFDAHPPFQIDGNFGGAAGIAEMLVQSHTEFVDILPALPQALPDGEVKGLCVRGGFVIDMNWSAGKLQQLKVISKASLPLLLRYNGIVKNMNTEKNGIYTFDAALEKL